MKIRHLGHACVLIEVEGVRVLIDPGTYTPSFEELTGLDVIAVTHEHPDHADPVRLPQLLAENGGATLVAATEVIAQLPRHPRSIAIAPSASIQVAGTTIQTLGSAHAQIHPLLPNVPNSGFIVGGRVWHPGDSFTVTPRPVEILLLPIGGPWMRLSDAIDFLRAVAPAVCIPIHEAGLSLLHRALHHQLLTKLAPKGTQYLQLDPLAEFDG